MRIFEINEPYLAVITANYVEECVKFYQENVSEVVDIELFCECFKELDKRQAINIVSKTIEEDTLKEIGEEEATQEVEKALRDSKPSLLAVDGALI